MGIEKGTIKGIHDGQPRKETKIEIESKLTLGLTTKTPDQISQELYELFSPTETGETLPVLTPEYTLRQYWWTGNLDDKHTLVAIIDRENPKTVKIRGKTQNGSGSTVLDRHEHKEKFDISGHIQSRNLVEVGQLFNRIAALSEKLRNAYEHLGPIMLKERRGFTITIKGIPLKITFDRTLEAENIHDWLLDQIEVEYDGEKDELDAQTKENIHQQILTTTSFIQTQFEQLGFAFQEESPSKDKWMLQHYGHLNGHANV